MPTITRNKLSVPISMRHRSVVLKEADPETCMLAKLKQISPMKQEPEQTALHLKGHLRTFQRRGVIWVKNDSSKSQGLVLYPYLTNMDRNSQDGHSAHTQACE